MFNQFQDLLKKAAASYNFTREFRAIEIVNEAKKVLDLTLPPSVKSLCGVRSFQEGQITLMASNSSAAAVLQMHKHIILKKLQERVGEETVSKIKISL